MADYPVLPLWVDDYLGDTLHLTTIEHGAYLLLLMAMWRNKGSLPNDDRLLARYARLTPGQWRRIRPTVIPFFTVEGDSITQSRLTKEVKAVRQKSSKSSDSARARWLKNKETGDANALRTDSDRNAILILGNTDTSLRSVSDAAGVDLPPDFDDLEGVEPFELPQPIRQPRPVDPPPPPPPPQPERPTLGLRDVLFRQGRAFFAAHGKTESAAAGMIARWLKDFDEATVLAAISAAEKERAVEPVSWINAHLQRQAKRSRREFPQSRPPPEVTRIEPAENWRCGAVIASAESVIPPPLKRNKAQ